MRLGHNHKQERAQPWPGRSSHFAACLRKRVAEATPAPAARPSAQPGPGWGKWPGNGQQARYAARIPG